MACSGNIVVASQQLISDFHITDEYRRRQDACYSCKFNTRGVCEVVAAKHGRERAVIENGISRPSLKCPEQRWGSVQAICPGCTRIIEVDEISGVCKWCQIKAAASNTRITNRTPPRLQREAIMQVERFARPSNGQVAAKIITGCDQGFLTGAYTALWTLLRSNVCDVVLFDFGIDRSSDMAKQIESWGVEFRKPSRMFALDIRGWQTYSKPYVILESLKENETVLWIDADTAIAGSIGEIDDLIGEGPAIPCHGKVTAVPDMETPEHAKELLGGAKKKWKGTLAPCAGVVGFSRDRDMPLVEEWCKRIEILEDNEPVARSLRWYDQCVLRDIYDGDLIDGSIWNNFRVPRVQSVSAFFHSMGNATHRIAHFGGRAKPWLSWGPLYWGDPRK